MSIDVVHRLQTRGYQRLSGQPRSPFLHAVIVSARCFSSSNQGHVHPSIRRFQPLDHREVFHVRGLQHGVEVLRQGGDDQVRHFDPGM